MNTQEYISSGIVESYVLGLASEEERREFEKMCNQHPEVLEARNAFEIALENQAMQNAIAPSADIKNKIFDTISSSAKIVSIAEAPVKKINWFKYAAVASVILLAGSLLWTVSLMNKNQDLKNNYESSVAKLSELEKDFNVLQQNPNVKMASMKGMEASPKSFATVYWDTTSHDVYLLMNNLPKPASDKQYQLWAFLDGQPIDMGLIEISDKPLQLYQLKKAQAAQAFAITLENKGRPDVSKPEGTVYVLGNL